MNHGIPTWMPTRWRQIFGHLSHLGIYYLWCRPDTTATFAIEFKACRHKKEDNKIIGTYAVDYTLWDIFNEFHPDAKDAVYTCHGRSGGLSDSQSARFELD